MAEQITNPFENEKPKIVHLEKSESHYEYCRMQMHDINRVHKRTFFCNMGLCMVVCLLAMFQQTVAGFDMLSVPFTVDDSPGMILAKGIFQIMFAMIIISNCKTPKEAAAKTFVFFLISQPLIYLLQVPFSWQGWGLFHYYKKYGLF